MGNFVDNCYKRIVPSFRLPLASRLHCASSPLPLGPLLDPLLRSTPLLHGVFLLYSHFGCISPLVPRHCRCAGTYPLVSIVHKICSWVTAALQSWELYHIHPSFPFCDFRAISPTPSLIVVLARLHPITLLPPFQRLDKAHTRHSPSITKSISRFVLFSCPFASPLPCDTYIGLGTLPSFCAHSHSHTHTSASLGVIVLLSSYFLSLCSSASHFREHTTVPIYLRLCLSLAAICFCRNVVSPTHSSILFIMPCIIRQVCAAPCPVQTLLPVRPRPHLHRT